MLEGLLSLLVLVLFFAGQQRQLVLAGLAAAAMAAQLIDFRAERLYVLKLR